MNDPYKHIRYKEQYKSNDFFWGIGIENETYLQFTNSNKMLTKDIHQNHKPERYSVNYFAGLNPEYKSLLKLLFPVDVDTYDIPYYMNAHTLQKTDVSGNHITTYEKVPKPNKNFKGKILHDLLIETSQIFDKKYNVNYMYDGDTIEFMTQNFYKTTIKDNIDELIREKYLYLEAINYAFQKHVLYPELGPLMYPVKNEPFVCFLTNKTNIGIFNNGTYHLNFTMPTQLDTTIKPLYPSEFVNQHKAAIRYIQYLEPLIIALYGTPDPFSKVSPFYSKASQRCAVSRYIGIGTYNTEEMKTGKILTIETTDCLASKKDYWWYTQYTKDSHYNPLTKIGVDINFNKHDNHGIEIRFLDWFPEHLLEDLMICIVNTLDYSLKYGLPSDPTICPIWNGLVVKMLKEGSDAMITDEEYTLYSRIFRLKKPFLNTTKSKSETIKTLYKTITKSLKKISGPCRKYMMNELGCGCL